MWNGCPSTEFIHRRELRHADIIWFDEHFLAALRALLPDVRSMFGFGSGRGDFERDFFNAVRLAGFRVLGFKFAPPPWLPLPPLLQLHP